MTTTKTTQQPQKPNSGVLFPNKKKVNPEQPDFTGNFTDSNGKQLRISAWKKTGKNGGEYLSLAFSEMNYESAKKNEESHQKETTTPSQNNSQQSNESALPDDINTLFDDMP